MIGNTQVKSAVAYLVIEHFVELDDAQQGLAKDSLMGLELLQAE